MKLKQIAITIGICGLLSLPSLILITGGTSSPSFWNYEQYIDPEEEAGIRKQIGYSAFGDLNELEAAINSNKVISAISSDYQAADFANNNVIQKIDFHHLWGLEYANSQELGAQLAKIYTPFVFEVLDKGFDLGDNHLWEYVVPYFAQQKVIAFDIRKGIWNDEEKNALLSPEGTNSLFPDKSYKGILNTLRAHNYHRLIVNDYLRDNMMIGSESSPQGFSSSPTLETYQEHINYFKTTIEDENGFNQNLRSNNVKFDTDGTNVLQNLVDPSKNWDTAILYNGDALDAYNAKEHFPTINEPPFIRAIFPKNPIYLTDVLIIPTYIDKDTNGHLWNDAYQAINDHLFKNANIDSLNGVELDNPPSDYPILINFNYIVYTLPYQVYDEAIKDGYFEKEDGTEDEIALNIYTIELQAGGDDIKNHLTQNVSDALFTSMFYYYIMMKN